MWRQVPQVGCWPQLRRRMAWVSVPAAERRLLCSMIDHCVTCGCGSLLWCCAARHRVMQGPVYSPLCQLEVCCLPASSPPLSTTRPTCLPARLQRGCGSTTAKCRPREAFWWAACTPSGGRVSGGGCTASTRAAGAVQVLPRRCNRKPYRECTFCCCVCPWKERHTAAVTARL